MRGRTELVKEAVTGGQYTHPKGLFYGGNSESWSSATMRTIADRYLSRAERVVVVDVHTGLGEYGHAEIILNVPETEDAYATAVDMWGTERVRSTATGDSVSSHLDASLKLAVPRMLPNADVTAVSLEFGTVSNLKALRALRAENWLHHYGGDEHRGAAKIKTKLVRAFYPDGDDWKAQSRDGAGLVLETIPALGVFGEVFGEDLDRDGSIPSRITGFVDFNPSRPRPVARGFRTGPAAFLVLGRCFAQRRC